MLLRQRVGESVGEEMWLSQKDGDELPGVVDHADDDSVLRRQLKQLVLDMTQYRVWDRLTAGEVLTKIKQLVDGFHEKSIPTNILSKETSDSSIDGNY